MTLTVGATHVVIGTGQFAIAQPVGLSIALAGIPGFVARDPGTPVVYHRVGRIAVGHVLGWQQPIDLGHVPQLVYPLAPEFTQLGYTLLAGVTATIGELSASSWTTRQMMPWDRAPTAWGQNSYQNISGAGSATLWTFTVPAGRKLLISQLEAGTRRGGVATAAGGDYVLVQRNGANILTIDALSNVSGDVQRQALSGDGMVLLPGEVVSAIYTVSSAGGSRTLWASASGFLFDA